MENGDENFIEKVTRELTTEELKISDHLDDSITLRPCDKEYISIESNGKEYRMLLFKNGAVELIGFLKNHFSI